MALRCVGSVAEHLQGENLLLLDTLKLIDFQGVAHRHFDVVWSLECLSRPMDVLLLFSVKGSLVLASNVVFAGIYVHLPNNEGSCSFRPSLQHSST